MDITEGFLRKVKRAGLLLFHPQLPNGNEGASHRGCARRYGGGARRTLQ